MRCQHSVHDQPDAASVHAHFDRVLDAVADELPEPAEHPDAARADVLAFTSFPKAVWRQIWSNDPSERPIRVVGAVPAEQHDEWAEGRRYLGLEALAAPPSPTPPPTSRE